MTCDDVDISRKENRAKRDWKRKLDNESVEARRAKVDNWEVMGMGVNHHQIH